MKESTAATYQERILRAQVHVQRHLGEELALDDLAVVAGFSPYHFHRIFRGITGESVAEYIRRLRLERAAHRLRLEEIPVTDLAFDAGYDSHEAFTRAFHTMFGMSPSQFRAERRPAPETSASRPNSPPPDEPDPVEIRTLGPMHVAFVRHIGPYNQVGPTWGKLMSWAGMRGLLGPDSHILGIVHDDPRITPADKVRYDAAVTVPPGVTPEGEVGVTDLSGGSYATILHRGHYDTIGESYDMLCGVWLPQSGREVRDEPAFEVYLNSPLNTAPQDLLTIIHLPVA